MGEQVSLGRHMHGLHNIPGYLIVVRKSLTKRHIPGSENFFGRDEIFERFGGVDSGKNGISGLVFGDGPLINRGGGEIPFWKIFEQQGVEIDLNLNEFDIGLRACGIVMWDMGDMVVTDVQFANARLDESGVEILVVPSIGLNTLIVSADC